MRSIHLPDVLVFLIDVVVTNMIPSIPKVSLAGIFPISNAIINAPERQRSNPMMKVMTEKDLLTESLPFSLSSMTIDIISIKKEYWYVF